MEHLLLVGSLCPLLHFLTSGAQSVPHSNSGKLWYLLSFYRSWTQPWTSLSTQWWIENSEGRFGNFLEERTHGVKMRWDEHLVSEGFYVLKTNWTCGLCTLAFLLISHCEWKRWYLALFDSWRSSIIHMIDSFEKDNWYRGYNNSIYNGFKS